MRKMVLALAGVITVVASAAEPVKVRVVQPPPGSKAQPMVVPLPEPTTVRNQGKTPGEVRFLAMGDWGQNTADQHKVAEAMASYAAKVGDIQCMLTAGDNLYVKLTGGVADPLWKTVFEDMYDPKRMNFPWYLTYGNHDFEFGKAPIELQYTRDNPNSRWKFPARYYRLELLAAGSDKPLVVAFMLDSNHQNATAEEWEGQKQWLDTELGKVPDGAWTICTFHHPPFTNGDHGDNGKIQVEWGPIFKKHNVDVVLCGHDHDLQHLEVPGWTQTFLMVGGGGGRIRPMLVDNRGPFSRSIYGFAHFTVTPEKMTVHYVGEDGSDLHSFERTKAGKVTILSGTPSDKATTKKLKTLQGIEGNKRAGDD